MDLLEFAMEVVAQLQLSFKMYDLSLIYFYVYDALILIHYN
jgi:hypothetical protein